MHKRLGFLILISLIIVVGSCKKYSKKGYLKDAGVALTFDDNRINNWYNNLNLLDSLHLKATFYISGYTRLTSAQKQKLQIIKSRGHEIGYHTITHPNMNEYPNKHKKTMQQMIDEEIVKGLRAMNTDGFYPKVFAYPYGVHNGILDGELKKYFKSIRALNGSNDYAKSLAATEKNYLLYGFGLDKSSRHSDATIEKLIKYTNLNNNCAVLVAHDINNANSLSVTKERLINLSNLIKENNLKMYTISEISE